MHVLDAHTHTHTHTHSGDRYNRGGLGGSSPPSPRPSLAGVRLVCEGERPSHMPSYPLRAGLTVLPTQ